MSKHFWDTELFVNEVHVSDRKKIVVKEVTKNSKKYIDIRQMFLSGKDWVYGKGIAIPYENAKGIAESILESLNKNEDFEKVFEEVK